MSPENVVNPAESPSLWIVDGFNVLQVGLLGGRDRDEWWTEPRRAELLARAGCFDDPEAEIWVVFDGPRDAPAGPLSERPALRQFFAPSADSWLLERARVECGERCVAVVTGDRKLAARARHRGARVVSPRAFLARCGGDAHMDEDVG